MSLSPVSPRKSVGYNASHGIIVHSLKSYQRFVGACSYRDTHNNHDNNSTYTSGLGKNFHGLYPLRLFIVRSCAYEASCVRLKPAEGELMGISRDKFSHSRTTEKRQKHELPFSPSTDSNNNQQIAKDTNLPQEQQKGENAQLAKNNNDEAVENNEVSASRSDLHINKKVNPEKQGKHIPGNPHYIEGKSIFLGTVEDAQKLVNEFAGTGEVVNEHKERFDFGRIIGIYVNPETKEELPTTRGIIHYSKNGAHIVPGNPKKE